MAKREPPEATWLTPKQALEIATKSHGDLAAKIIMERLRAGFLIAIASRISHANEGEGPEIRNEPTQIDAELWVHLQDGATFWSAGDARFFVYDEVYPNQNIRCTGIRFLEKTIREMFPVPDAVAQSVPQAAQSTPAKHPGGAPAKPIWEAVWIEIAARLYNGDLQPQKQADLEKAIMDIVMILGDECGEATAKRRAKLLWQKIKEGS